MKLWARSVEDAAIALLPVRHRETVPEGVGRDVLLDPGGLPIGEAALI
jgi:hypothetical protein